ncbi:MAG: hypothetical protein RSA27_03020, partial [Oscillospiraceae bacterium]
MLVGEMLIGKSLQIQCTNENGATQFFTFNEQGAKFHNTGVKISSDNEGSGNGITLGTSKNEGLIITRNTGSKENPRKKFRVKMNADE